MRRHLQEPERDAPFDNTTQTGTTDAADADTKQMGPSDRRHAPRDNTLQRHDAPQSDWVWPKGGTSSNPAACPTGVVGFPLNGASMSRGHKTTIAPLHFPLPSMTTARPRENLGDNP